MGQLYNAFGAMALDQSVMAATPLLKQINTSLTATPAVYVVNPGGTVTLPSSMNVNVINPSTPPNVQNVSLLSTPVVVSFQGAPYTVVGTVTVSNFPTIQNVNIANVATPPAIQKVQETATPITVAYQGSPFVVTGSFFPTSQQVWLATPNILNVNVANPATPPSVQNVSITSTPIVYAQLVAGGSSSSVSVTNFPGIQNVNVANQATPAAIQKVAETATPITVTYQGAPFAVTGFPTSQQVWLATPTIINVNVANQATPPATQNVNITSTPIVYAQVINQAGSASNVNVTNTPNVNIASTPIVYAQITNPSGAASNVNVTNTPNVTIASTPISIVYQGAPFAVTVSAAPLQNVNIVNPATPPPFQQVWLATPAILNVNIANQATPPATQNVNVTSTPIVYSYHANGVAVTNFPATQNVNITSTPIVYAQLVAGGSSSNVSVTNFPATQNVAITSTPISVVYAGAPFPVTVNSVPAQNVNIMNVATPPPFQQVWLATPAILNVNIANQATPPALQNVALTSTPIVYALHANGIAVTNFPATQNVNVTSTPIVYAQVINQSGAASNVNVTNTPNVAVTNGVATPIVVSYQPSPYTVTGNVGITSTPIVYAQITNPGGAATSVSVTNFPATQNVAVTSTPIVYAQIISQPGGGGSNVSVTNFPSIQNVNLANVATPPATQNVAVTNGVATPIVVATFPVTSMGPQGSLQVQASFAAGQQQIDSTGNFQPIRYANINLYSGASTPLVWAGARTLRVIGYSFVSQNAGAVMFAATPLMAFNAGGASTPLAGPFFVAANGGVVYASTLQGPAFEIPSPGGLYISTIGVGTNVGGHLAYVYV